MKKTIVLSFCVAMALSATACGSATNSQSQSETGTEISQQIPSPFITCDSIEDAIKLAGFNFTLPDTLDDYKLEEISAIENEMIQIIFQKGEEQICIRKAPGTDDISGDYNVYSSTKQIDLSGQTINLKGDGSTINTAVWYDETYAYSISCTAALSEDLMESYINYIITNNMVIGGDPATWGPSDEASSVEIADPYEEFDTLEEAEKQIGFDLQVPESIGGYHVNAFRVMDSELLEVLYQNDDDDVMARVRKSAGTEDISGDYTEYPDVSSVTVGNHSITMKGEKGKIMLVLWNANGYSYSVSVDGLDQTTMVELVSKIQ